MVGKSELHGESHDDLFLCLHPLILEGWEQATFLLMNHSCAHLDPSLPLFKDETRQVVLDDRQETRASSMNMVHSTICIVWNKSSTVFKSIHPCNNFLEAVVVKRVRTKNGVDFATRNVLCNKDINSMNIISLFLDGEGLMVREFPTIGRECR